MERPAASPPLGASFPARRQGSRRSFIPALMALVRLRIAAPERYRRSAWMLPDVQNLHLRAKALLSAVEEPLACAE
jgi:hypothetical protein